jgi:hypothetical protein
MLSTTSPTCLGYFPILGTGSPVLEEKFVLPKKIEIQKMIELPKFPRLFFQARLTGTGRAGSVEVRQ